jgi:nitrate reductase assembly molybdenum cofactor insertion protein NarJ
MDLKECANKQLNEVRKLIQDLDKRLSNMDEKFSKDIEILRKTTITTTTTTTKNQSTNQPNKKP